MPVIDTAIVSWPCLNEFAFNEGFFAGGDRFISSVRHSTIFSGLGWSLIQSSWRGIAVTDTPTVALFCF
jgi:hypothetical protein